jgi:hypothetical protein
MQAGPKTTFMVQDELLVCNLCRQEQGNGGFQVSSEEQVNVFFM